MKVYLGGPINGCTDDEANGWRDKARGLLAGHQIVDPMDRDYRGMEMEPGIATQIVELDKEDIDSVDFLIMMCPKPSVGTSMETLYAWGRHKLIVCVVPADQIPSPWLVYHANAIVPTLQDACEWVGIRAA